uniref:Uncharacterized protein n=1 Tax=Trichuris muris TaxID=70415 RepID=A0A5S6QME7_TRIMR
MLLWILKIGRLDWFDTISFLSVTICFHS